MNTLQIRTIDKFKPFDRWTKDYYADVYKDNQSVDKNMLKFYVNEHDDAFNDPRK